MLNDRIELFAKLLVKHVRDAAIRSEDATLSPNAQYAKAKRWKSALDQDPELLIKVVIPDIVDDVIFCLLDAIDNEHLKLSFQTNDGKNVDLCEEGYSELAGSYIGTESWRAKYSNERFNDFSGLLE